MKKMIRQKIATTATNRVSSARKRGLILDLIAVRQALRAARNAHTVKVRSV